MAVVEDHPLYREALVRALRAGRDLTVTAATGSVEELEVALAGSPVPAVIVLDMQLPGTSGVEAVRHLAERGAAILVVTAVARREDVLAAFSAGARGYLTKSVDVPDLLDAVRRTAAGGNVVDSTAAPFLVQAVVDGEPSSPALTPGERAVLALVAAGRTDRDIAERLVISVRTVRSRLDRIREKTGARRRADLTRLAVKEGLTGAAG